MLVNIIRDCQGLVSLTIRNIDNADWDESGILCLAKAFDSGQFSRMEKIHLMADPDILEEATALSTSPSAELRERMELRSDLRSLPGRSLWLGKTHFAWYQLSSNDMVLH